MELLLSELRARRATLCNLSSCCSSTSPYSLRVMVHYTETSQAPPHEETEEAMGLLALLASLSYDAWVAMVVETWPTISAPDLQKRKKHLLILEVNISSDFGVETLRSSRARRQDCGRTPEYLRVLQCLQDERGGEGTIQPPHVPMHLVGNGTSQSPGLRMVREIIALYPRDDSTSILTIAGATFLSSLWSVGVKEMVDVVAINEAGVPLRVGWTGALDIPCEPAYKLHVTKAIRQLLAVHVTQPSTIFVGSYSFKIWRSVAQFVSLPVPAPTPSYWIPALFSGAHSSQSVSYFDMDARFSDLRKDRRLHWMVYAVLLRTQTLTRLKLNCSDIEMRDVNVVEDILSAEQPLHVIVGDDALTSPSREIYEATSSRFHLFDPRTARIPGGTPVFCSLHPVVVPVIDASSGENTEWFQVVLAGQGPAWVHREDIIEFRPMETDRRADWRLPTNTLVLRDVNSESADATLALLSLIHRGLTRLEMWSSYDFVLDDWLRQLLTICSDLTDLEVTRGVVESLDGITDAFQTGTLRLNRLMIALPVNCRGGNVRRFFEALADSTHAMTSHLTELEIRFMVDAVEDLDFVHTMSEMFRTNTRLMRFKIRFCLRRSVAISRKYFRPIRDTYRDDWAPFRFDSRSKLAFLSAVTNDSGVSQSASKLPTSVLAMIFELCGKSRKRHGKLEIVRVR